MVGKDERARSQQSISLCAFTDWVPICFYSVGGTQGGVVSEATRSGIASAPDLFILLGLDKRLRGWLTGFFAKCL